MTLPINNDNISTATAGTKRTTVNDAPAKQKNKQDDNSVQAEASTTVERASEKLAQEANSVGETSIQNSSDAREMINTLKSLIQNNPQQAMAAHNGLNAQGADAALTA